jgi:TPR repeat protein
MSHRIPRNAPCPCGSGIKYKKCCILLPSPSNDTCSWVDDDGMNFVNKGTPPSIEEQEEMTKEYQKNIKKSSIWTKMVQEYGEEKAEEMLKDFQVQIK